MPVTAAQITIAEWIDVVARRLEAAGLFFGHGTDNARDEAAWLVLHASGAPLDGSFSDWGRAVTGPVAANIENLVSARCNTREPMAYLTGSAFFAGLEFEVTPEVLVPRSPIAELILDGFRPWLEPGRVEHMLDMCTGSGCIAIAAASVFSRARVDAADLSRAALAVAKRNVSRHGVEDRVRLIESNLFQSVTACRYDLIVANPPYVPRGALGGLPAEFRSEPELGLVSGDDGLDAALSILLDAPEFLGEDGILVCEVGESEGRLVRLLPKLPFLWLEFEQGGSGVFVLSRQQLDEARPQVAAVIGERQNVT